MGATHPAPRVTTPPTASSTLHTVNGSSALGKANALAGTTVRTAPSTVNDTFCELPCATIVLPISSWLKEKAFQRDPAEHADRSVPAALVYYGCMVAAVAFCRVATGVSAGSLAAARLD